MVPLMPKFYLQQLESLEILTHLLYQCFTRDIDVFSSRNTRNAPLKLQNALYNSFQWKIQWKMQRNETILWLPVNWIRKSNRACVFCCFFLLIPHLFWQTLKQRFKFACSNDSIAFVNTAGPFSPWCKILHEFLILKHWIDCWFRFFSSAELSSCLESF